MNTMNENDPISAMDPDGNVHNGWFVMTCPSDPDYVIVELDDNVFSEVRVHARYVVKR